MRVSLWRDDFSLDGNKTPELRWFRLIVEGGGMSYYSLVHTERDDFYGTYLLFVCERI